jgi:hypothetical protein
MMTEAEVEAKLQAALDEGATKLDFSDYGLETISEEIGGLTQLRSLNLSVNRLRTLPESIGNLKQLETLNVAMNQLERLPESIGNLTWLRWLNLSHNRLLNLPDSFAYFQTGSLILHDNPLLTSLPCGLWVQTLNVRGCTHLTRLPNDTVVSWFIELADSGLTELPAALSRVQIHWKRVPIDHRIAFQPETITYHEVLTEKNVEKRRVLLERMGLERFIREVQPEIVDTDYDPGGERQLFRIEWPDDMPVVCLSVIDPSTGRQYMLRVPPRMRTCRQAAAWIAGFDNPDDYRPLVET